MELISQSGLTCVTLTPADGSKEATALPLVEDAGCLGRAAVSSFPSESGPQVFTKGPAFKPAPEPILATGISPRVAGDAPALCKEMLPRATTAKTRLPTRVCGLRGEPRLSPPQESGATPRPAGVLRETRDGDRAGLARRAQAARSRLTHTAPTCSALEDSPAPSECAL